MLPLAPSSGNSPGQLSSSRTPAQESSTSSPAQASSSASPLAQAPSSASPAQASSSGSPAQASLIRSPAQPSSRISPHVLSTGVRRLRDENIHPLARSPIIASYLHRRFKLAPLRRPTYLHASTNNANSQYAPVFAYEIPTNALLSHAPLDTPEVAAKDEFLHAYVSAFGEYPGLEQDVLEEAQKCGVFRTAEAIGRTDLGTAVFVKHSLPGSGVSSEGLIRHPGGFRFSRLVPLESDGEPLHVNKKLLSVAVVTPPGTLRNLGTAMKFDIDMKTSCMSLVVFGMVRDGSLRIFFDGTKLLFFVSLGEERALVARFLRWVINWKSGGECAEYGGRENPFPREYDKDWVYNVIRRTPHDYDQVEYQKYMERVEACAALNVTLRPYQQRAVAWMLSKELGPPVSMFGNIVWDDARTINTTYPNSLRLTVKSDIVINIMGKVATANDCITDSSDPGIRPTQHGLGDVQDPAEDRWGHGGLLCDEMGLGKTVELMQLVACNTLDPSAVDNNGVVDVPTRMDGSCPTCEQIVDREKYKYLVCAECDNYVHATCEASCKRSDGPQFVCRKCVEAIRTIFKSNFESSKLPRSKATVVVIPTSLLHQWESEIAKHVKDGLHVILFQGLKKSGYISRRTLMQADVVLTTYEALAADVAAFRALRAHPRSLRHAKKYTPTPIPLLAIHWHRLALDESQMLGSNSMTKAAEMASFFHATYRWCVTGTPMSRCLSDALPLLNILRIQGGSNVVEWSSFCSPSTLLDDEIRLQNSLRKIMWRTSKEDVESAGLPPQITEVVTVSLGAVEKYHYENLQDSVGTANVQYRAGRNAQLPIVPNDLLTMLRQACCHPQIGISGRRLMSNAARRALRPTGSRAREKRDAVEKALQRADNPLGMDEVLDALVTKSRVECEEALRVLVSACNGLAAVCWLQYSLHPKNITNVDGFVTTVQLYRETLGLAEENRHLVRLDDIQKLHVLFNLHEALNTVNTKKSQLTSQNLGDNTKTALTQLQSLGNTTRDAKLPEQIEALRQKYVGEAEALLVATQASYIELFAKLGDEPLIPADSDEDEGPAGLEAPSLEATLGKRPRKVRLLEWWHLATASLMNKDDKKQVQFLNRVVRKLLDGVPGGGLQEFCLTNRISSLHSLALVVEPELAKLQNARKTLKNLLLESPGSVKPTQAQIAESGQCRECRKFGIGPPCVHCRLKWAFKKLEKQLYLVTDASGVMVESPESRGGQESVSQFAIPKNIVSNVVCPKSGVGNPKNKDGLRFRSESETILKCLAGALRHEKDAELNRQVSEWFERLESLKKEFIEAKQLLEAQRSLLARIDEVNMAVMRFSVTDIGEDINALTEDEKRHRLPRQSLPILNVQFSSEKRAAEANFRDKRSSLVYLTGLQRSLKAESNGEAQTGGVENVGVCVVCLSDFAGEISRMAVFACGHVFCCDCTRRIITRSTNVRSKMSKVQCPTCRIYCAVEEINFTVMSATGNGAGEKTGVKAQTEDEESEFEDEASGGLAKRKRKQTASSSRKQRKVHERKSTFYDGNAVVFGHNGAKASATVRTLRGIWQEDAKAKVLIFSEWDEVLKLISVALEMNSIEFLNAGGRTSSFLFSMMVKTFKTDVDKNLLLLPLKRAGAGLNLIEATHVILMEPSMNVLLEAQAVNRVHRIGQTRKTFVHRIIIRDTIEEVVLALGDNYRNTGNLHSAFWKVNMLDVFGAIETEADGPEQQSEGEFLQDGAAPTPRIVASESEDAEEAS